MHFAGKTATGLLDWRGVLGRKGSARGGETVTLQSRAGLGGVLTPRHGSRVSAGLMCRGAESSRANPKRQARRLHLGDGSGFLPLLPHATTCPRRRLQEANPKPARSPLRTLWPPGCAGGGVSAVLRPPWCRATRVGVFGPRCTPATGPPCSLPHPRVLAHQADAFLCAEASWPDM